MSEVSKRPAPLLQLALEQPQNGRRAAGQTDDARQVERVELAAEQRGSNAESNVAERTGGVVEPRRGIEPETRNVEVRVAAGQDRVQDVGDRAGSRSDDTE